MIIHKQYKSYAMNCLEVWGGHGEMKKQISRPGLDVSIWSQARQDTVAGGGDLHLISSCASGRITRMLLADVCGFGALFTEIAGRFRDLMKRNVNSVQQCRAVRQLASDLEQVSLRGGFASAQICTYFAPTHSFTLCNAGHPPPLLFRAKTREWSIVKQSLNDGQSSDKGPGVVDPVEYQQFKSKLEVGDMVLSYSNALTECRGQDGRVIGLHGLLERVQQVTWSNPLMLPQILCERIEKECNDNLANQDATLMLAQATKTPVGWRNNVLAPFRLLQSVSDRTTIR